MALSVKITRTLSLDPGAIFVQWDLVDATESGLYFMSLYRGGSSNGPWEVIFADAPNTYNYRDTLATHSTNAMTSDLNMLSLVRSIYYRLVVTPPSGPANAVETVRTVEPNLEGRQRLIKRKILRDEMLQLKKLNGVPVAVLKRRRWGVRCPKCYDKYTKDSVRGACTNCYGTTFVGGYHDPVITYGRRGVSPANTELAAQGKVDVGITKVVLLDMPAVEQDDVLVFISDNSRYIVKKIDLTELRTVTVHQTLTISELPNSSIEHRLRVDPNSIPPLF